MAHTPYGYKIENGVAVLDEIKSKQVKELFNQYVGGGAIEKIGTELGIIKPHATLGRMLSNKHYMGDAFYPAIINEALWEQAQHERLKRADVLGRNKNYFAMDKTNISPFWGLVYCTECGSEYRRYVDYGKERWRCSKRFVKGRLSCNSLMFNENVLETAFLNVVSRIIVNISAIKEKPAPVPVVIDRAFDDPIKQAEYVYSQVSVDDFDFQTSKFLEALQNAPQNFNGDFMKTIIRKISVSHSGTATFYLKNNISFREELKINGG